MTAVVPEGLDLEVDPDTVAGERAHAGLLAAFHAENHAVWQRCRWLLSACRARAGTTRRSTADRYAPQAAAAALAWSGAMAAARYDFAYQVLERLPMIGEAMRAGWMPESKASTLVAMVRDLDDEQAREVVARVLARAAELVHGAWAALVEKTAAEVDPAWHEARRQAAEARARVVARTAPSGAAELSGLDLPHDPAKEAYDHVVALADAVGAAVTARGRDLRVGVIEAHVYLRLLHPDLLGVDDATVVDVLTDELAPRPHDDGPDDAGPDEPGPTGPDDSGPGDSGSGDFPPDGPDESGPDGPHGPGPDDSPTDDPEPELEPEPELDDLDPSKDGPLDDGPLDDDSDDADDAPAAPAPCGGGALAYRPRVVVRAGLATLLGRDHRPGEVPGWGTVATSTARTLIRNRPDATVHLILHTPDGHFTDVLALRPTGRRDACGGRHRRQIIELTATTALLDTLDPAEYLGPDAALIRHAQQALATLRARPPEQRPALTRLDALRRHPRTELDRHVRARDRRCRFPGCTRQAIAADLDHTLDWGEGGLSLAENLGALCRYHHRLKHHPGAGWNLSQPTPGHFVWISPQGARHTVDPPREDTLTDPLPAATGGFSVPADTATPEPRRPEPWTPRRTRDGRITDAARTAHTRIDRDRRLREGRPPSRYDGEPDF